MNFAEWLQSEIEKRGLDQSALARKMGVTSGTVSNVLNGNRQAGPDFCIQVAWALNLSREEVFRRRGWLRDSEGASSIISNPRLEQFVDVLQEFPSSDLQNEILRVALDLVSLISPSTQKSEPRMRTRVELMARALEAQEQMMELSTVKERMAFLRGLAFADRDVFNILDELKRVPRQSKDEGDEEVARPVA